MSADKQKQKAIAEVTRVRVWLKESAPPILVIQFEGLVTTTGWSQPDLKPRVYNTLPEDGMYDFDFLATPPDGPSGDQICEIGDLIAMPGAPDDIVGIRVHAASNWRLATLSDSATSAPPSGEFRVVGDGSIPWL